MDGSHQYFYAPADAHKYRGMTSLALGWPNPLFLHQIYKLNAHTQYFNKRKERERERGTRQGTNTGDDNEAKKQSNANIKPAERYVTR